MTYSLTDWKNQDAAIGDLVDPPDKQSAREAAIEFDRVRDSWIARVKPRVESVLEEIVSQVRQSSQKAERPSELNVLVRSAVTAARPMYESTVKSITRDVANSFYDRITDSIDGKLRPHAYYMKQETEQEPRQQGPTQTQDEVPIGTAIGLFVAANAAVLIAAAHSTTKTIILDIVNEVVDDAVENGWSVERAVEAFVSRLGTSNAATEARVERIARTLVTRVANWAGLKAAKDSEEDLRKGWLSVRDERVRPAHLSTDLDGEEIPLDAFFDVGGFKAQFPSDPRLPPSQSLNCRCTLYFVSQ